MANPVQQIMIVDDHYAIRRGIRDLVESNTGYRVVGEASNGREALKLANETRPDIVILDYSLPGINGLHLAHLLLRGQSQPEILLYTMHDREDVIIEILRAGVRGFVLKTDPEQQVFAALDALSNHQPYFSGAVSNTLVERFLDSNPDRIAGSLTYREREVIQRIAEGQINKQVAHELGVSIKTIESHRSSAMQKLKLRTTADLVRYAVRSNIILA